MKYLHAYFAATAALLLSSCGGGSGGAGSNSTPDLQFSGTVAIGAPLQNVVVAATCADGKKASSQPTSSTGAYALSVQASLPCSFQALEPTTGFALRSISISDGTVNVTPLTEALFVFANGDSTRITDAKAKLSGFMTAINSPLSGDPISTPFQANSTGLDKNILDLTAFVANNANSTSATGPGALAALPAVFTSLRSNCGSTDTRCITNESLLAKVGDLDSRAIARDIFVELDAKLFVGIGNSLYTRSFDSVTRQAFERGYKYALSILIDRIGPSVMKASGISKTVATEMAASFSDDAIATVLAAPKMKTGDVLELLAASAINILVDHIEEATIPTLALDGSWSEALKSVAWGSAAYTLEIAVGDAVFCAFHSWACSNVLGVQLVTLKTEVEALFSRLFKDISVLVEIAQLNSDANATNARNAVMEQLLAQYANLSDPNFTGAKTWATSGAMSGSLSSYTQPKIAAAKAAIPNVFPASIEAPWRAQISSEHTKRLDRLTTKWSRIETTCRALKQGEGEVGVSKCLNAMRIDPAAPISCGQSQTLSNGSCTANPLSTTTFLDNFDGATLDAAKWSVSTAASSCCGAGNPATYTVSGGYLNIAVPGGSCGFCGVPDGSIFSPKVSALAGDFEVYVSFQELSRTSRDGTGPMNPVTLELSNGAATAGVYVVGDVLNNSGTRGHTIYAYGGGAIINAGTRNLSAGQFYSIEFRVRRISGVFYLAHKVSGDVNWTETSYSGAASSLAMTPKFTSGAGDGGGTRTNSSSTIRVDSFSIKQ